MKFEVLLLDAKQHRKILEFDASSLYFAKKKVYYIMRVDNFTKAWIYKESILNSEEKPILLKKRKVS